MHRIPCRAVLSLTGPDTLALLERTVTHAVADWAEGEARYGALLTPQGKVIADYIAHRTAEGVLVDVHEDAAADLLKRLKMFRLRSAVEIEPAAGLVVAIDDTGRADPRAPGLPGRMIAEASAAADTLAGWDRLAIRAGIPEWGRDYRAAEVFPTDINMDRMGGIDYRKGCFVGQEVASRMKRKALIRKRTIRLRGPSLEAGAEVRAGPALLGTVTSVSGEDGLALVRIDRLAAATEAVTVHAGPVAVVPEGWLDAELGALAGAASDD